MIWVNKKQLPSKRWYYTVEGIKGERALMLSEEEVIELVDALWCLPAEIMQQRATEEDMPYHETDPRGKCAKDCPACEATKCK